MGTSVFRMDSNQYAAAVAAKIEKAIKASGLSRNAVSKQTGIPYQTLTRRIASRGGSPFSVREVKAIADTLGTTAAELTTVYAVQERQERVAV